jgi:hypothetical protein
MHNVWPYDLSKYTFFHFSIDYFQSMLPFDLYRLNSAILFEKNITATNPSNPIAKKEDGSQ